MLLWVFVETLMSPVWELGHRARRHGRRLLMLHVRQRAGIGLKAARWSGVEREWRHRSVLAYLDEVVWLCLPVLTCLPLSYPRSAALFWERGLFYGCWEFPVLRRWAGVIPLE